MQVAIIHYHFDRGGVTQAVLNHLRGLASAQLPIDKVMLVHGGRAGGLPLDLQSHINLPIDVLTVDGLEYDASPVDRSAEVAPRIANLIQQAGGSSDQTVLHVHNHSLGKNASLPGVVRRLADSGWGLLLQIHDFAEDYRPQNYRMLIEASDCRTPDQLESFLYPQADNIHYAVLTSRDAKLLESIGMQIEVIHRLPNSIQHAGVDNIDPIEARRNVTRSLQLDFQTPLGMYPVRGIRRKNVGEMLLWSAVRNDINFAVTLAPTTPVERKMYDMWSNFAAARKLSAIFDAGEVEGVTLAENSAAADFMFTSSVAEGFGMVFLESCLADRDLIGRDLPDVTTDFRSAGMNYPGLTESIFIPSDLLSISVMPQIWEAYGAACGWLPDAFIDALDLDNIDHAMPQPNIDFARLPVGTQAQLIAQAAADRDRRARSFKPILS
ncbi:MAG: hypothetical protein R3C05_10905 [Pirellulaceae bacterium]